jgi:hypothetical protein
MRGGRAGQLGWKRWATGGVPCKIGCRPFYVKWEHFTILTYRIGLWIYLSKLSVFFCKKASATCLRVKEPPMLRLLSCYHKSEIHCSIIIMIIEPKVP